MEQTVTASGPKSSPSKTARLDMVLSERVDNAQKGTQAAMLVIAIVEATAEGQGSEAERQAATGRVVTATVADRGRDFQFAGGTLGTTEEIRMADIALMAHLLEPTKPKRRLLREGDQFADSARFPTAWFDASNLGGIQDRYLYLNGSTKVIGKPRAEGRRVLLLDSSHTFNGKLTMTIVDNPEDVARGEAPMISRFFAETLLDSVGSKDTIVSFAEALLLPYRRRYESDFFGIGNDWSHLLRRNPASIEMAPDSFEPKQEAVHRSTGIFLGSKSWAMAKAQGPSPSESDLVSFDMAGSFEIKQRGSIHRSTGILLSSESMATAHFEGNLPQLPDPDHPDVKPAAKALSMAPVEIDFEWKITKRLAEDWPQDRNLPLVFIAAGALVIALLTLYLTQNFTWE